MKIKKRVLPFLFLAFAPAFMNAGGNRTTKGKMQSKSNNKMAVLYDVNLANKTVVPDLNLNGAGQFDREGLNITHKDSIVKLNRFYALGERVVKYQVKFSSDAKALFRSSQNDFSVYVDVPKKRLTISTSPAAEKDVPFLQGNRDYTIEIYHIYQKAKVRIIDNRTQRSVELSVVNDGTGGCGKGSLQKGFAVGMQWDHYCFGLASGTSFLVKRITVCALKGKVKMLLYGDSITQPEGYFPTKDFSSAWTQLIMNKLGHDAMSSGRGGGNIYMLSEYIKNELPHIKAKYVMVTIGTNGGNTEENLTELVNYIRSQGAIPILNNIPCNESGTQISNNEIIEKVRKKEGIKGCRFDIVTSLAGDGKEVDKSLMFWEDYTGSYGWQIYHHPNEKGGRKMFERTLTDIPEIYR